MRLRLLLPLALAVAAGLLASGASADVFVRVKPAVQTDAAVPSAALPNFPGSVVFPPDLSTPPPDPIVLDRAQLVALWQRAGAAYGIPWQVLGAINQVESDFGRNMGPSSAGAIGWMQFMPSTWTEWGVDASGDGVADPWNPYDAVFAAARYLAASGGTTDIARAIFSYNHAEWYVQEVLRLSRDFGSGGAGSLPFSLDRLQVSLDGARQAASEASARAVAASAQVRTLGKRIARLERRAGSVRLLSTRLELEDRAGHLRERLAAARGQAAREQDVLQRAQSALSQAQQKAAAPSFDPAAQPLLAAPTTSGNWVFPVGGGPQLVSAAHTHHDYPAVDIAAPEGSPVYALSDAVVLRSWFQPDPTCGIGVTLRTSDGQTWTYCHLSYMDPDIVAGASLPAGASIGLVGMTGDASGPHLHLQLDPPTTYPQDESWFQSFAGTAFRWQDAPTPAPAGSSLRVLSASTQPSSGPVFTVEPSSQPGVVLFDRP
jgi:murein DD-endopeptidase MepM/ murein hydrolase activator NlpD